MKKLLVCILILSLSFASVAFGASVIRNAYFNEDLKLVINGNPVDIRIVTVELEGEQYGRNYYSIADLVKALNDYGGISAKVDFDSNTKTTIIEVEKTVAQDETVSNNSKQAISVSTPVTTVTPTKTPTPMPTEKPKEKKTVEVPLNKYGLPDFSTCPSKKPFPEDDGTNVYFTFDGVKYISFHNMPNHPKLLPDNYRFERDMVDGKLSDVIAFKKKNPETNKWEALIEEVPYTDMGFLSIKYDYYINTVKPLIVN